MATVCNPSDSYSFVKSIPAIVTAIAAMGGVLAARAGLNTWRIETIGKRRAELAEDILAGFYQAQDIIDHARSPMGYATEGLTRQRADGETENESRILDSYFRTTERLTRDSEFWGQLHSKRYRFLALFGREHNETYNGIFRIKNEIIMAVRMLITMHRERRAPNVTALQPTWEMTIGWGLPEEDTLKRRIDALIEAMEAICRPAIQETANSR